MSPFYCSADTRVVRSWGSVMTAAPAGSVSLCGMDGIHDLGGMVGFEKVEVEANEPVFHDEWEGRVCVMLGSVLAAGVGNVDKFRHAIERLPARRYLSSSYYERWLSAIETLLIEGGILTREQIEERMEQIVEGSNPDFDEPRPRDVGPTTGDRPRRRRSGIRCANKTPR